MGVEFWVEGKDIEDSFGFWVLSERKDRNSLAPQYDPPEADKCSRPTGHRIAASSTGRPTRTYTDIYELIAIRRLQGLVIHHRGTEDTEG